MEILQKRLFPRGQSQARNEAKELGLRLKESYGHEKIENLLLEYSVLIAIADDKSLKRITASMARHDWLLNEDKNTVYEFCLQKILSLDMNLPSDHQKVLWEMTRTMHGKDATQEAIIAHAIDECSVMWPELSKDEVRVIIVVGRILFQNEDVEDMLILSRQIIANPRALGYYKVQYSIVTTLGEQATADPMDLDTVLSYIDVFTTEEEYQDILEALTERHKSRDITVLERRLGHDLVEQYIRGGFGHGDRLAVKLDMLIERFRNYHDNIAALRDIITNGI